MKSAYKFTLSLLLVGFLGTALGAALPREYSKAIKREFDITPSGTTSISNKYGKVEIKTWDRNRVKIDVTIIVNASSEKDAQKVFERIDIAFTNTANYVKAVTSIEPQKKGFWDWGDSKNDYSINYEVFLPPTNDLELTHKYGDVYVAELSGRARLDVKYGNLKVESVGDDSYLTFGYSTGSFARARDLVAEISYSRLNIDEARDLELETKYTQLSIQRASDISCNTKYDDYEVGSARDFRNVGKYDNIDIGTAENLEVSSKYTQVNAKKIAKSLDIDMQYGGASVGLSQQFGNANLAGSYSDFKVNIDRGTRYRIEATANNAGISYPSSLNVTYELEKGSNHEVKGYTGPQEAGPMLKARLSYGGIKIRED